MTNRISSISSKRIIRRVGTALGLLVALAARAQAPAPAPAEPAPRPVPAPATLLYTAQLTGAYAAGAVERTLLNTSHTLSYAWGRHFGLR